MNKKKSKFLILGITTGLIILTSSFILLKSSYKEENKKLLSEQETANMLSYTLDGQKTDIKPTKESGYIANKISCENGSNLIWDNTNWEVEIIKLESNDVCSVDFTKDANTNGYRVTATTNVEGSIDSLSKSTIENGTIIFYPTEGQQITGVSGCTGVLENNKVIVSNVTSIQTCNIEVKIPLKTLYATLSDGSKYTLGARNTSATSPIEGTSITDGYKVTSNGINYTGGIIFKTGDDYYFAGNPSDNWVKFGKDKSTGKDLWWRIIRTNSTEGTRLLYAGTGHDQQNGYINGTYKWYNSQNSADLVRWNNASFATGYPNDTLTSWYNNNITGTNDKMVNSVTYCNDVSSTGSDNIKYGAYTRLSGNSSNYICGANGNTTHTRIGLMTADEVVLAGSVYKKYAPNTYYYRNSKTSGCTGNSNDSCSVTGNYDWWTMSPAEFNNGSAKVFYVTGAWNYSGYLNAGNLQAAIVLRPVITLLPSVKVSGSGTTDDPFVPSLTN